MQHHSYLVAWCYLLATGLVTLAPRPHTCWWPGNEARGWQYKDTRQPRSLAFTTVQFLLAYSRGGRTWLNSYLLKWLRSVLIDFSISTGKLSCEGSQFTNPWLKPWSRLRKDWRCFYFAAWKSSFWSLTVRKAKALGELSYAAKWHNNRYM